MADAISSILEQERASVNPRADDIEIHAHEILHPRDTLAEIYARHTGKAIDQIKRDTERDNFMSAHEAKAYGPVAEVLASAKVSP